ncbi:MAG: DUF898 family protein [Rubrivivax sp.]|nr:MAG: DUF898 family protein [Rubrivivax sp.]
MSATALSGALPRPDSSALTAHQAPRAHQVQRFRVRFTGSGREYFRIWIVNLLLVLVTAGFYYPWAQARKYRYFHAHTVVASHALGFHGDPRKMMRSHLVMVGLLAASAVAMAYSRAAGALALVLLALASPAWFQARTRARLASTSWRGLRFGLTGRLKDAYAAVVTPLLALLALLTLSQVLLPAMREAAAPAFAPVMQVLSGALLCVGLAALLPYAYWRLKCHQQRHRVYAQLGADFRARYQDMLSLFINTATVAVLSSLAALVVGGLIFMLGLWARPDSIRPISPSESAQQALPMWLGVLALAQVIPLLYFRAKAQNLVWTRTGNRWLRFRSELGLYALLRLSIKNWTLLALTLGLYWPFASVAMTRLKLQSVCVHMRISPDLLVAQAQANHQAQ